MMPDKIKYLIEEPNNDIDLIYFFKIMAKNFRVFAISFLVLSSAFIFYIYYSNTPEYSASFPVSINKESSKFVINDLENISKFTKSDIKSKIKCSDKEIESINFIKVSGVVNEEEKNEATININTNSPEHIKQIVDKTIEWASKNKEAQEVIAARKSSINSLIEKIDQQLKEIQSLKKKVLSASAELETKFSFSEELNILEKKYELTEELAQLDQVITYSSQIYIPSQARNKSKKLPIAISLIVSLLIASLLTLFFNYKKV